MDSRNRSQATGNLVAISRAYVVYDRTSGEILHIHRSETFPQGAPLRETPESRARRFAGSKAGENAAVIEVDPADVNHRNPRGIRIDTVTLKVVPK
jgi:hypothetical protein